MKPDKRNNNNPNGGGNNNRRNAFGLVSIVLWALFLTLRLRGRIHETGVYLAMGISKGSVLLQYLLEVILVAAIALVISFGTSTAISHQIGSSLLSQVTSETYETVDLTGESDTAEEPTEDLGLAEIEVAVSAEDYALVWAFGMVLCVASTALAAYPELGCTGGPYEVWNRWGISDDVLCAGNDQTLQFIDDVLSEIIEIFPSEYIHVGGDECPKVRWSKCPKCQARIKALGIKPDGKHTPEQQLQSYIIGHAEKFLNEHGRRIIGWDEIMEGGITPTATVMAWRSAQEGIKAAKMGNDAIMTPTSHLYFDYYQSQDVDKEPQAIGGYVPVKTVYNYEPVPEELTPEEAKHIIGVQANLWTEYIPNFRQVEYMEMPRIAALAEVQWTDPSLKEYDSFLARLGQLVNIYNLEGYNYAQHVFDVNVTFRPNQQAGVLDVVMLAIDNADIHYTLDGSEPTASSPKYTDTLKIDKPCTLKAVIVRPSGNSRIFTEEIGFNKASMKPITMLQPINKQYEYEGAITLVDGLKGNDNYKTGRWIAFWQNDMEAVIDLQQPTEISEAQIETLPKQTIPS